MDTQIRRRDAKIAGEGLIKRAQRVAAAPDWKDLPLTSLSHVDQRMRQIEKARDALHDETFP